MTVHRRGKGFMRNGDWVSEPPYPWRDPTGYTNEMEISAWRRYEHMREVQARRDAGHPIPFMTKSEVRWFLFFVAIIILGLVY